MDYKTIEINLDEFGEFGKVCSQKLKEYEIFQIETFDQVMEYLKFMDALLKHEGVSDETKINLATHVNSILLSQCYIIGK